MGRHFILAPLLLTVCSLPVTTTGFCQDVQKIHFEHITTEQGLTDNDGVCILQDKKGYLWFGTVNGLNKYDGYTVTAYQFDPHDSFSISYNTIMRIWEDKDDLLWLALAGDGVNILDRTTEKFHRFKPGSTGAFSLSTGFVSAMYEEGDIIWFGNSIGQLARYNKRTNRFFNENLGLMLFKNADSIMKANPGISVLLKDKTGTFWVGTASGLYQLKYGNASQANVTVQSSFYHNPLDKNGLSSNNITCLYEAEDGVVWIGTDSGLNKLDPITNTITRYSYDPKNKGSISNNFVSGIAEDKKGNLWISTRGGLNRYIKNTNEFINYFHNPNDPASLSSNLIFSMLSDRSGTLWMATIEGGIDKLNPYEGPVSVYNNNPADPKSISSNKITAICEDNSGTLWIGTWGAGLNVMNRKDNTFLHYRHSNDPKSLPSDQVSAILQDSTNLWIASGQNRIGYLSLFDRASGNFTNYKFDDNFKYNISGNPIFYLYQDRGGMIWLGTGNGIVSFNPSTKQSVHYAYNPKDTGGLSDYWAESVHEDKKGNLWIGSGSNALTKFNRATGRFFHYRHVPDDPNSISVTTIKDIAEDADGNLWFATEGGGLCKFDLNREIFTTFAKTNGLPSNTLYSILEDGDQFWVTTDKGLSRFSPATATFTNYDIKDGLPGNQFAINLERAGASYRGKDGMLYFGGPNGLIAFNPRVVEDDTGSPEVVITQFKVHNKVVPGKNEAREIVLNHNENFFSFEFAALNFINTSKNQYAYQLVGVDKDWVYSRANRFASYTNLAPGNYEFKVKSSNKDGIWNAKGTSVKITILPPWYQTWWFYGICFLAAIALIYLLFQYRLQQKLQVLQTRNRLHRDLHDDVGATLSSVKVYSEILKNDPDNLLIADLIKENAAEMMEKLEVISWATDPIHDNFKSLKSKMQKFAMPVCHALNIQCDLNSDGINEELMIPGETRQNVFLVFKEAVSNTIKYAGASKCKTDMLIRNNRFILQVIDDGKGADGTIKGNGNGWKNMKKRCEQLNGKLEIQTANGKGTSITMSLPYPFKIPNGRVKHKSY